MSSIDNILSGMDRYFYDCDCEKCQSFRNEIAFLQEESRLRKRANELFRHISHLNYTLDSDNIGFAKAMSASWFAGLNDDGRGDLRNE